MRDMLINTNKRNKDMYGMHNIGIMVLLKYWGDPQVQMDDYIKILEEEEEAKKKENE
jgi:hypothetical protein